MESASGSWREKSVPYFKTTQQWTTTLALAADQFFSIGFSNLQLLRCQLIFFEEILKLTWKHAWNIICPLKTCLNESIQTLSSIATFISPACLLSWVFSSTANGLRGAIYKRGKRQTTYRQLDFEVGFPLRPFWQRRLWRGCWQTDNPINDTALVTETGQALVKFSPTRSRASRIVLPSWTWFFKVCDAPEWQKFKFGQGWAGWTWHGRLCLGDLIIFSLFLFSQFAERSLVIYAKAQWVNSLLGMTQKTVSETN